MLQKHEHPLLGVFMLNTFSHQFILCCFRLMRARMSQMNLSARAYHHILKLARTIADLAGSEDIQSAHLAEALQYRLKLMMGTM